MWRCVCRVPRLEIRSTVCRASSSSLFHSPFRKLQGSGGCLGVRPSTSLHSMSALPHVGSHESELPRVTLLTGFLGAGKTTTLSHILQNRSGRQVGVIVNDVASVNIDGAVIRRQLSEGSLGTEVDMIELENGCLCCGPQAGALAPAVRHVHELGVKRGTPFEDVIIELSGVADPNSVRKNLMEGGVNVDRIVTLVDGQAFLEQWATPSTMQERPELAGEDHLQADPCAANRGVVTLLVSQIEAADVIVVNKMDLASTEEADSTEVVCASLCPNIPVVKTTNGEASLSLLLPEVSRTKASLEDEALHHKSISAYSAALSACIEKAHSHDHERTNDHNHQQRDTTIDALGITSFVYHADRPFKMERLVNLIERWPMLQKNVLDLQKLKPHTGGLGAKAKRSPFGAVLRSKGYIWVSTRHDISIFWSHAGRHIGLEESKQWFASLPFEAQKSLEKVHGMEWRRKLKPHWDEEWGDRASALVLIGMKLNEASLRRELDACLVTDEELTEYRATFCKN